MKKNRTFLIVILTVVLCILAACGNAADKSNAEPKEQPLHSSSSNIDITAIDENPEHTSEETDNNEVSDKEDTSISSNDAENSSNLDSDMTENQKEEYLKKFNDTKKEMDELQRNSKDTATYAMKKVEDDRYDVWDEWLNEVYGVLKAQISTEEMDELRKEQRDWIKHRDDTALEASFKYKGGTAEHLEYVTVQANLTEERCYELVENYMK
ncbi:DUF1311 domain-containing protein [Bacillus sp. FJAT-49711]|uniref:lysozyme inhibitor LprI family protein n=1 Tax=Bacillus sp. FJAT-49711 TaxID=2833585 RepID=UPI001BC9F353|nr:lysozyme inhibitor LprI family protein [Bacillus sp. FJAT-49711]MBS4218356.1 DUF1311 domain-containing protein [Bacillus sp. FJAT-49711]